MNYIGSEQHRNNAREALRKATAAGIKIAKDKYEANPKVCLNCNLVIPFEERKTKTKFCSRSCSASISNKNRIRSKESKRKTSKRMKGKDNNKYHNREKLGSYCKLIIKECKVCNKCFSVHQRKNKDGKTRGRSSITTCSEDCRTYQKVLKRNYQNKSKFVTKYFNKWEDKEVILESSWEVIVAEYLDSKNIKWIRPGFIKWFDDEGKTRRYFPDFYLVDYDFYLDPKNPYCQDKDKEKIKKVSQFINLKVGLLDEIIDFIDQLS